ncbi:GGDEF domain-containing protein, partial [Vibrio parahaemolyticus]|nr:GGDEF domain-containing protein [Vibrio parahaemolyticus]
MFRFAIPSPLMADWQHVLRQCCDVTQAQGQLYTLSDTQQWLSTEVSTSTQNHRAIIDVITQVVDHFTPTDFTVSHTPFEEQTLSIGPIWLPNGELLAVLTLTHPNDQSTVVSAWLSAMAGRISFDINLHWQQEQTRHQSAEIKPTPTLQEFIDCLEDHVWIKGMDGLYSMTNRSVENAWQKTNSEIIG